MGDTYVSPRKFTVMREQVTVGRYRVGQNMKPVLLVVKRIEHLRY